MRAPKVEIAGGEGFDLLVSAVAVADPDWRDVMAHGAAMWSTVRHDAGAEAARQAARFGRFGWINLIGLLAAHPGRGGRNDLVSLVDGTPADELRFVIAGGRREQLRDASAPNGCETRWPETRPRPASSPGPSPPPGCSST